MFNPESSGSGNEGESLGLDTSREALGNPDELAEPTQFEATNLAENFPSADVNPDVLAEPLFDDTHIAEDLYTDGQIDPDRLSSPQGFYDQGKPSNEGVRNKEGEVRSQERYRLYTTPDERINCTPFKDVEWVHKRGDSLCKPQDKEIRKQLRKFGIDGIEYKDGIPDFSPVSTQDVSITMTSERHHNFKKADEAAAKEWNKQKRGGESDWKARDIENWRKENHYTWHECSDQKTCQLVPTDIHNVFTHSGGVAECKKREGASSGGGFDEYSR